MTARRRRSFSTAPVTAPTAGEPVGPGTAALPRPDAGALPDAGTAPDAGALPDAGTAPDAGALPDAGTAPDAGALPDAGTGAGADLGEHAGPVARQGRSPGRGQGAAPEARPAAAPDAGAGPGAAPGPRPGARPRADTRPGLVRQAGARTDPGPVDDARRAVELDARALAKDLRKIRDRADRLAATIAQGQTVGLTERECAAVLLLAGVPEDWARLRA